MQPLRFLCLADSHGELPEKMPQGPFDAILHAGDLDAGHILRRLERKARKKRTHLFFVPGNHDMDDVAPETAQDLSGRALRLADALVLVGVGLRLHFADQTLLPEEAALRQACAEAGAAARQALRPGDRLMVLCHYAPLLPDFSPHHGLNPGLFDECVGELVRELRPFAFIHGHVHTLQNQGTWYGETLVICAGQEWSILTVDPGSGSADFQPWAGTDA